MPRPSAKKSSTSGDRSKNTSLQTGEDELRGTHDHSAHLLEADHWLTLQYSDNYGEAIREFLGRDPQEDDLVKTCDGATFTFDRFLEFQGQALKRRFPIQVKSKNSQDASSKAEMAAAKKYASEVSIDREDLYESDFFSYANSWVAGPLLIQFNEYIIEVLETGPQSISDLMDKVSFYCTATGPVILVMLAAKEFGLVEYDDDTGKYSLVQGDDLKALRELLSSSLPLKEIMKTCYHKCAPPFAMHSKKCMLTMKTFESKRYLWRKCGSRRIIQLFDGMVLMPLLASFTFIGRWGWETKDRDEYQEHRITLRECPKSYTSLMLSIIRELELGELDQEALTIQLSDRVKDQWERLDDFFKHVQHAKLVRGFHHILTGSASWGFIEPAEEPGEREIVRNPLNRMSPSDGLRRAYHWEFLNKVHSVFSGHDFAKQPAFIVDSQSIDGMLLAMVYHYIRNETPRGKAFKKYPLVVVAINESLDTRRRISYLLKTKDVPHKVLKIKSSDIPRIVEVLPLTGVDPKKCLHVRAFADQSRIFQKPQKLRIQPDTAVGEFVETVLGDTLHLDNAGDAIPAVDIFASLVEHLSSLAKLAEGGSGICMLNEVSIKRPPASHKSVIDSPAVCEDLLHGLGRNYCVPPIAYQLASGMAGLLPPSPLGVTIHPKQVESMQYVAQHATHQEFKIRLAEVSDIDRLMEIESYAWEEHLRAPREGILRRLKVSPTTCFAVTMKDEVVAVLYAQKIRGLDSIFDEKFQQVSNWHDDNGEILQLIAINVHPSCAGYGLSEHLRVFGLRYAQMSRSIKLVCAVTLCQDFKNYDGPMESYLQEHVEGERTDLTVQFHTGFGAKFVCLVPGYRPEDHDNKGTGVLISYNLQRVLEPPETLPINATTDRLNQLPARNEEDSESGLSTSEGEDKDEKSKKKKIKQEKGEKKKKEIKLLTPTIDFIRPFMEDYEVEVNPQTMQQSMFSHGLDSLELVQLRNQLVTDLGISIPATIFLDYPTLEAVCERLDERRGVTAQRRQLGAEKEAEGNSSASASSYVDAKKEIAEDAEMNSVPLVMAYLREVKRQYSLPQHQMTFRDVAQYWKNNAKRHLIQIEPIVKEIQLQVLLSYGLLREDFNDKQVRNARIKMSQAIKDLWRHTEVSEIVFEIQALAKVHNIPPEITHYSLYGDRSGNPRQASF